MRVVLDGPRLTLAGTGRDLAVLAERSARHDASAPLRLVADGHLLATFVATPFDALAVRVTRLAEPGHCDVVVEAVGLAARARAAREGTLLIPPRLPDVLWTTPLPPRSGWTPLNPLTVAAVRARLAADTEEFQSCAAAVPPGRARSAALEAIAAELWARPLVGDVPGRLAHAADYLGFLPDDPSDVIIVRRAGPWRRLDARHGATMARTLDPLRLLVS
jgi:hypothetical protein